MFTTPSHNLLAACCSCSDTYSSNFYAGAKSILDLAATLEYLQTMGVPVIGYGTDKFPAFFSTAAPKLS